MRKQISLNQNWKFAKHVLADNESFIPFYRDGYDDSSWSDINVPHDSSIVADFQESNLSGPRGGYAETIQCYYSKHFTLSAEDAAKRVIVEFEGVYMNATYYVNGEIIGVYPYGYTTVRYDISDYVRAGENKISVTVNNEMQPGSRWYSGTGIYRPVNLYITERSYFEKDDIIITTPVVSKEAATVQVDFKIFNEEKTSKAYRVDLDIMDGDTVVAHQKIDKSVAYQTNTDVLTSFALTNPKLWCNKTPNLYTLVLTLSLGDTVLDTVSVRFGVRSIQYTSEQGFLINGEKEWLKGVCIHHDNGALGAKAYREAFVRKIEVVKAMGANAIRTSHNPEAPEFLDLCDEYGMYVMEEAFDEWQLGKRPRIFGDIFIRQPIFAYAKYFDDWAEKDLSAMVRRDRNHASIIMWSIGNEIEELRNVEGEGLSQMLINIVHQHDRTRPATAAFNGLAAINKTECPEILDICGYNYAENFYKDDHAAHPLRCVVGSETASITPFEKRGKYTEFLKIDALRVGVGVDADPEQFSAKEGAETWVIPRVVRGENSMIRHMESDYVAGMFIWTGIDYLGEPTPQTWPSISSYFAPIDRALFPKDAFYYYKSCWSDEDVLHILPHWTFDNVSEVPVWCYTNCDEVELFVNGVSQGKQTMDRTKTLHLEWHNVPYAKGEISAIGYRNGNKVEASVKTAYDLVDFTFTVDKTELAENELCYAEVSLRDAAGTLVPNQDTKVTFSTADNAAFIVCDNGDPEFSDFNANSVDTLAGLARGIFTSTTAGTGTLIASVEIGGKVIEKTVTITCK